jgi:hypothetical protein
LKTKQVGVVVIRFIQVRRTIHVKPNIDMNDLAELRTKKDAYAKAEAQKIIDDMVTRNVTASTLATCDAPNWNRELHRHMLDVARELNLEGIRVSSQIRFGVTDWTFTIA